MKTKLFSLFFIISINLFSQSIQDLGSDTTSINDYSVLFNCNLSIDSSLVSEFNLKYFEVIDYTDSVYTVDTLTNLQSLDTIINVVDTMLMKEVNFDFNNIRTEQFLMFEFDTNANTLQFQIGPFDPISYFVVVQYNEGITENELIIEP